MLIAESTHLTCLHVNTRFLDSSNLINCKHAWVTTIFLHHISNIAANSFKDQNTTVNDLKLWEISITCQSFSSRCSEVSMTCICQPSSTELKFEDRVSIKNTFVVFRSAMLSDAFLIHIHKFLSTFAHIFWIHTQCFQILECYSP